MTLEPDRNALARYGLTVSDFATTVGREVRGTVSRDRIEIDGEELPLSLKALVRVRVATLNGCPF